MKNIIVLILSFIIFVHHTHHAQEVKCLYDIDIVYKNDSHEKVAQRPLYQWLQYRQSMFQIAAKSFDLCRKYFLLLANVAFAKKEYDAKIDGSESEIFKIYTTLSLLPATEIEKYKKLWHECERIFISAADAQIYSLKNNKDFLTRKLLCCFPSQKARYFFQGIRQVYFACSVFFVLFIISTTLKNQPECRHANSLFSKCFMANPLFIISGYAGLLLCFIDGIRGLLVLKANDFVDVDQALQNKQKALTLLRRTALNFFKTVQ